MRPDFEVEHVVDDLHVRVPFAAFFLVREVEVPEALYRMARRLEVWASWRMSRLARVACSTHIVAILSPFDDILRACFEFGGQFF